MGEIKKVSFEEAKKIMDENPTFVMIDVRDEAEFISGHASDAILLPLDEITPESVDFEVGNKETPILLYCKSGERSHKAALLISSYGYTKVYDIGSLIGWPYGML